MAQQLITVRLNRGDATPWGFRLTGGVDFGTPLALQKVNGGSLADSAGLVAGDALLKVNGVEVFNLRHKDAQDVVVRAGNNVEMTVQRGGGSTWKPNVAPMGALPQAGSGYSGPVTKTSLAAHQQPISQPAGTGYNTSSKPFANGNGYQQQQPQQQQANDPGVKSIVNKQYNTPVGIYSEESIAETLSAQAEVLAGGVLGVNFKKNEKAYDSTNSEVFKMLQEAQNDPPEPEEPRSFSPRPQQQYQANSNVSFGPTATHHVNAPVNAPVNRANTGGLPTGQNICAECERLIVGVFVRIKDKNLHVECFRCATCGSSLKNQGYFNIHNKLYCDVHAKLIAMKNPPPGTEGYVPVPIKPSSKLSANTISQALSQHHNIQISGNPSIMAGSNAPITHTELLTAGVKSPSHTRTNSSASSTTTHSCTTSPTPSTSSAPHSPAQFISPSHSRENSLTGSMGHDVTPMLNHTRNNHLHHNSVWTANNNHNSRGGVDSKLLKLESDCFQESPQTAMDNDKENARLIMMNELTATVLGQKDETDSILFKTLDGRIIKSVQAPGKGKPGVPFKVNSNASAPKPYNYPPMAAPKSPSMAAPRSPSYPYQQPQAPPAWGQQQQQQQQQQGPPAWSQPQQQQNNYNSATLPRSNAPNNAPAGNYNTITPFKYGGTQKRTAPFKKEPLDEISEEIQAPGFAWPPKNPDAEDNEHVPTATPLYVPPPETQHVKAPPPPTEVPPLPNRLDAMNACQSAPELRNIMTTDSCSGQQHEVHEIESGSESCTSTTNTTSEDYAHMKIYQPGPPGAIYDQGFSDSSEYVDMSSQQQVQQQQSSQVQHKQSICSSEVMSINESAEYRHTAGNYLAKSLDTQCLVDTIRAITPRPASPLPLVQGPPRQPKHVEFVGIKDEEVTDAVEEKNYQSTCEMSCQQESSTSCCMAQSEIPVMKQLPPTQIQNAVPHEWESAMVKALQTAPNTAYYGKEAQGSLMSSVLTTCPSASMDFTPKFPNYPVPLPEETPAYFPPPINMKVIANTDICGAKSPMLSALITAPDRPYSPFPGEVIYQLDDLPTPTCKMNMQSALQTASDRPYTPMQFDSNGLATATSTTESRCMESTFEERSQQQQQQSVSSAFASVTKATPQPRAYQPPCDTMAEDHHNFVCTSSVQASICQAYNQQRSVEQSQVIQSQALNSSVEVSRQQQSQQQQQSVEESSVQVSFNLPLTQCNNPARKKEQELKVTLPSEVIYSTITKTPPPPPPPPVTTVYIPEQDELKEKANTVLSALLLKAQLKETVGQIEKAKPIERRSVSPPLPPPPTEAEVMLATLPTVSQVAPAFIQEITIDVPGKKSPIMEDTVVRMRNNLRQKSQAANDRRSYVEKPTTTAEDGDKKKIVPVDPVVEKPACEKTCGRSAKPQNIANDLVDGKHPICCVCDIKITRGPFITALGRIWCPDHFVCVNGDCRRQLADIGFVEEKGDLYCEYCFEKFIAPSCSKCNGKIKGDCLNAIGKPFHPECFTCSYCGKLFGNSPFFLEDGQPYCEADWNEMFTTKCFACGFPVEAGDRWVEALSHNYHSQCFNCSACKTNLEGQSFFAKNGRPFCKNHAR